jgi:hypothetical protein
MVMKSSIFWDKTPYSPLNINDVSGADFYPIHASFFLGLFSDPENGCNIFLSKRRLNFNRFTRRYIPAYKTDYSRASHVEAGSSTLGKFLVLISVRG